jgi:type IV pilus assembly protein PilA
MFASMRKAREKESGFTLIELLVVIIIIGILAAIAIPTFLNQRKKGWEASAKSALKNAATAQESYFTDNSVYGLETNLEAEGFNQSDNVTFTVISRSATAYCMSAKHDSSDANRTYYLSDQNGSPTLTACT